MATYTLDVNDRTKLGKNIISLLSSLDGVKIVKTPNKTTIKALEDAKNGKVKKISDISDFLNGI